MATFAVQSVLDLLLTDVRELVILCIKSKHIIAWLLPA